jgi:hypothetical protein
MPLWTPPWMTGRMTPAMPDYPLATPPVGTAWSLGGFTLVINGPPPSITEDPRIQLLLGGQIIDAFTVADFPAATYLDATKYPLTGYHPFTPPFIVFDTSTLVLRQNFKQTNNPPGGFASWRYTGNVQWVKAPIRELSVPTMAGLLTIPSNAAGPTP